MTPLSTFVSFIEEPFDLSLTYSLLLLHYVTRQYDKLKPIKNQIFPLFLSYNIPFTPVNMQPYKKSFVTVPDKYHLISDVEGL